MYAVVDDLSSHSFIFHAVDGPRGPRGIIKPGLIRIAQLSGTPIVPVFISVDRAWKAKSWDRFLIPKPFCRITVRWGDLINIPEQLDAETFENYRLQVEQSMRINQNKDDSLYGWTDLFS